MVEPITTILIGKWILTHLGIHGATAATAAAVGTGAAIAAIGVLVYIGYLTLNDLIDWFQKRTHIATKSENVPASFIVELKSGKPAIVQGVFNRNTASAVEARTIQYESLESKVRQLHSDGRLVTYE
jgi:hypothetical protein